MRKSPSNSSTMSKSGREICILALAAVCVAGYLVNRCTGDRLASGFDETVRMTISRKEKLVRLATVKYYEDLILYDRNSRGDTVAVVIAHPEVIMGVDLRDLSEEDFNMVGDTIYVNLPPVKVLHTICNPSQREIVYSAKDWDLDTRMKLLVSRAKRIAETDARKEGAMKRAEANAAGIMTRLLTSGSDRVVVVSFTEKSARDRTYSLPQADEVH